MSDIIKHYTTYGNTMMVVYTIKPGKNSVTQLKYITDKQLIYLIDGYTNMRDYQNGIGMTLNANLDDLIFILNDELFNRRIKELNYGNKQNYFRKILQR